MKSPKSSLLCVVGLSLSTLTGCGGTQAQPQVEPKTEQKSQVDARYAALPNPGEIAKWSPPEVEVSELGNGLTLWHLEQDAAPLVSVALLLPLGSVSDPEGKEGLTMLTADMLDEGAGDMDALQLNAELGRLATDYQAHTTLEHSMLSMGGLAENFEPSMDILSKIVTEPRLPADEFARRRDHHVATAVAAMDSQDSRLDVALHRVLFQDGYAGDPDHGTRQTLEAITLADVEQHAGAMTVPQGAHLIVVGDVSKQRVEKVVAAKFSKWTGKSTPREVGLAKALPAKTAYIVDFPGAAQSSLVVARPAGGSQDPHYFSELVMNEKLGGSFVSRINMNLREDKGYTYGAFTIFQRYPRAGYFAAKTSVRSDATAASVQEIFSELKALCAERPLTAKELQESVDGLLLGYPLRFERAGNVALQVASLPMLHRPKDFLTTWPSQVEAIDLKAANEAAQPYCDLDAYRVVIAGDLDAISPGLKKLGLDVAEMDKHGRLVDAPTAADKDRQDSSKP